MRTHAFAIPVSLSFSLSSLERRDVSNPDYRNPAGYYHYRDITVTVASLRRRCSIGHRSALLNRLRRLISVSPVSLLSRELSSRALFTRGTVLYADYCDHAKENQIVIRRHVDRQMRPITPGDLCYSVIPFSPTTAVLP